MGKSLIISRLQYRILQPGLTRGHFLETAATSGFNPVQLLKGQIQILPLSQKLCPPQGNAGQKRLQLPALARLSFIHADDFGDFRQFESKPFTSEDEFQPRPVALGIEPLAPMTAWRDQFAILIKPQGPCGDAELCRQIGYGEKALHTSGE